MVDEIYLSWKLRLQLGVSSQNRRARLLRFLEREIWPSIPEEELGRTMSRGEEDAILGYGAEGI